MLSYFFDIKSISPEREALFKKLKIGMIDGGKYMNYYGKFRVIVLDFKNIIWTKFYESFRSMISRLFFQHKNIIKDLEEQLSSSKDSIDKLEIKSKIETFHTFVQETSTDYKLGISLEFLSGLISEYCKEELVILIDEIDNPIMEMITSQNDILTKE